MTKKNNFFYSALFCLFLLSTPGLYAINESGKTAAIEAANELQTLCSQMIQVLMDSQIKMEKLQEQRDVVIAKLKKVGMSDAEIEKLDQQLFAAAWKEFGLPDDLLAQVQLMEQADQPEENQNL